MAATKKPSPAQLAARAKFTAMVKAKAAARKQAPKKVAGLDKITKKGKKTTVHYSRINGINSENMNDYELIILRVPIEPKNPYSVRLENNDNAWLCANTSNVKNWHFAGSAGSTGTTSFKDENSAFKAIKEYNETNKPMKFDIVIFLK